MRQTGAGFRDVVDVEEHRTRDVAAIVIFACRRGDPGEFEGRIDGPDLRVVEVRSQPLGLDERFGTRIRHRLSPVSHSAKARMTRRFCLPLFSILVTATGPISLVLRICVPPQGCRSIPDISMSRTRPIPAGGLTDIVRT